MTHLAPTLLVEYAPRTIPSLTVCALRAPQTRSELQEMPSQDLTPPALLHAQKTPTSHQEIALLALQERSKQLVATQLELTPSATHAPRTTT
jgi:hypothetical protein